MAAAAMKSSGQPMRSAASCAQARRGSGMMAGGSTVTGGSRSGSGTGASHAAGSVISSFTLACTPNHSRAVDTTRSPSMSSLASVGAPVTGWPFSSLRRVAAAFSRLSYSSSCAHTDTRLTKLSVSSSDQLARSRRPDKAIAALSRLPWPGQCRAMRAAAATRPTQRVRSSGATRPGSPSRCQM
jgi:hypothetical protein